MEIRQLIRDVRQNLVVAMAAFVLCVLAGAAAAFLPAKHYTASTAPGRAARRRASAVDGQQPRRR